MAVALPENISQEFYDFLASVDAGVQRPSEHVLKIAAVFVANDIGSPIDLIGANFAECSTGVPVLWPRVSTWASPFSAR